ncbi:hypothetical protein A3B56_01900 [Candidatus Roizmanbacteria bacterium RIFCSPLOWO2_01_FULL_45_11]|uniref:Uncharacterized protein n=1 Tax=Candidatus Roizmanbacteria bacterium RIFCSPLOWO2_01_FULL_45_11 TaxID=1802070 RepID=A0A1F7JG49_9BACT|nr:MAG: hypothetical protein A3B56_01900 [Candidatus Roizmanbacteria bacterium RIFCSPLOWO2_01_FULL_45_11]
MSERINVSEAKQILKRRFALFDKHNRRYHQNAAQDDKIRFDLLESGPCGHCQYMRIVKIWRNGNNAVDLECSKGFYPIDLQYNHEITSSFPYGMFDCEEFDPK